jgi:hypothetical protein
MIVVFNLMTDVEIKTPMSAHWQLQICGSTCVSSSRTNGNHALVLQKSLVLDGLEIFDQRLSIFIRFNARPEIMPSIIAPVPVHVEPIPILAEPV